MHCACASCARLFKQRRRQPGCPLLNPNTTDRCSHGSCHGVTSSHLVPAEIFYRLYQITPSFDNRLCDLGEGRIKRQFVTVPRNLKKKQGFLRANLANKSFNPVSIYIPQSVGEQQLQVRRTYYLLQPFFHRKCIIVTTTAVFVSYFV